MLPVSVRALLFVAFFAAVSNSQCSCTNCPSTADIAAIGDHTVYSWSCNPGYIAVITDLAMSSSDSFTVLTEDYASSTSYYTAASAPNSTTCYNKSPGYVGGARSVVVVVDCLNLITSCTIVYNIKANCIPDPNTYSWSTGSWSSCSSGCTQTRSVTCKRDSDSALVADSYCSGTKPSTSQACSGGSCCSCTGCLNTTDIPAIGDHTVYSWSCNPGYTAVITDLAMSSSDSFTVLTEDYASSTSYYTAASAPNSTTCYNKSPGNVGTARSVVVVVDCLNLISSCTIVYNIKAMCIDPNTYSWSTGSWSSCSSSCTQTRTVTCKRDSDSVLVADSKCSGTKPSTSQTCSGGSCVVPTYSWSTGSWSSCSSDCTQARPVSCRRDSDSTLVANSKCSGMEPSSSQTCSGGSCSPPARSSSGANSSSSPFSTAAIGGVVAGVIVIGVLVAVWYRKGRKGKGDKSSPKTSRVSLNEVPVVSANGQQMQGTNAV